MVSSAFILAAISMAASSVGPAADAFAPSSAAPAAGRRTAPASASRPLRAVDEADARALSDYLSKSHEERLRAVREVEERKNAEIEVNAHATRRECGTVRSLRPAGGPVAQLSN